MCAHGMYIPLIWTTLESKYYTTSTPLKQNHRISFIFSQHSKVTPWYVTRIIFYTLRNTTVGIFGCAKRQENNFINWSIPDINSWGDCKGRLTLKNSKAAVWSCSYINWTSILKVQPRKTPQKLSNLINIDSSAP